MTDAAEKLLREALPQLRAANAFLMFTQAPNAEISNLIYRIDAHLATPAQPATNQPEVTVEEQIEWMRLNINSSALQREPEFTEAILASLLRLQRIEAGLREPSEEMCAAAAIKVLPSYRGQLDHQHAYDIVSAEDMKVIWQAMSAALLREVEGK